MRSLTLPPGIAPVRLDVFLVHHVPRCSRRTAQRAIAAGEVRINGRRARKGQTVAGGDVVLVRDDLYEPATLQANPRLVVPVLYENASIIAVDKPAGMPCHALRPTETETVANFLLARYPELSNVGKSHLEPGIVHRLDTDTSGVLLAARTVAAYDALRGQFASQQVTKEYLAVVDGDVASAGELRVPIAHKRRSRGAMRVCSSSERAPRGRPAVTAYRPIERFGNHTLLAVQIRTGVMHQIRVHLASIGHPVVGDRLYGRPSPPGAPPHHLLHACRLGLTDPESGQWMQVSSSLPVDWGGFLDALREKDRAFRGAPQKARS